MKNRVLVIGATGYIGRHLLTKLCEDLNNQVYGLSNPGDPSASHWHSFEGDLMNPNLKNLVVGIQLRSFDLEHKGGMNRVPEALRLKRNPFSYYSSWFVAGVGWSLVEDHYPEAVQYLSLDWVNPVKEAEASEISDSVRIPMAELRTEP